MTAEGAVRPVLHCYLREHLFMSPREAADIRARFAMFAEREGFALGKIYTEKLDSVPEAFGALVQALLDDKVTAVAVPSLHHLAVLGHPTALEAELQRATGARVLVAGYGS